MTAPADRLRRAAEVVRTAADAATPSPWRKELEAVRAPGQLKVCNAREADAAFIALLDPDVGRALADWLDATADSEMGHVERVVGKANSRALVLADRILGPEEPS